MSEFEAGNIIDGRYRVLYRLGVGGMADVYLAQDEQLDRQVAIKLLHRRFAEDPGFVERFRREAQAAASLQHPNVVSVFDRGAFDGTYYIAMEYLEGRTLKRLIRDDAPLELNRAIDLTVQMLKAARFAHRRGVIHRDLKPHNVIVDDNDHVKVTDFGIARAGASDMTETGSIMGTAQYLSPEQAQGHAVSAPSDLYSIGIVLYEMLTGRVPFDGESPVSIALKHVSEAPVPPSQFNPEVPSALEQVVLWSLNKDQADRPADADQFIMALEQVREALASPEVTASMRALTAGTAGYPQTSLVPAVEAAGAYGATGLAWDGDKLDRYDDDHDPDRRKKPIWPWIVGLIVLLLIGGGVATYLLTRPQKTTMPIVIKMTEAQAETTIQQRGLYSNVITQNSTYQSGTVIGQNPDGGTSLNKGSTVVLTVSSGPQTTSVPNVEQLSRSEAVQQIEASGLKISSVRFEASSTVPAGDATRTYPVYGQSVQRGSSVILWVSSGLTVPNVVGDDLGSAQSALAQFTVKTVNQTSTTATPNTVLSQTPSGGEAAPTNATVTLTIAQAPDTVRLPRVVGDTPTAATATLNGLGLNVNQASTPVHNPTNVGVVVQQNPGSTSVVKKNSTVTITVGVAASSDSGGSTGLSSGGKSTGFGGNSINSGGAGTAGRSTTTSSTTPSASSTSTTSTTTTP